MAVLASVMSIVFKYMKKLDQRFPAHEEALFVRSLDSQFCIPLLVPCLMIAVSTKVHLELSRYPDSMWLFKAWFSMYFALFAIVTCGLVLLRLRTRSSICLGMERLAVFGCLTVVSGIVISGSWYTAKLFGRDPIKTFGRSAFFTHELVVLSLDTATTFICLCVPARSHLTWLVPTCGMSAWYFITYATSSPNPDGFLRLSILSGFMCTMKWIGGRRHEKHLRIEWRSLRQVENQKGLLEKQHQGFSHLLNRLCDCLLHLGPDFEIMESCPNLNAMLFLSDRKSLQGTCFLDYLATTQDQDRFVPAMHGGTSDENPAGVLPVHLKAQNQHVQAHVYFTCFQNQDGSPYYIIGIVEAGFGKIMSEPLGGLDSMCARSTTTDSASEKSCSDSELTLESVHGAGSSEMCFTLNYRLDSAGSGFIVSGSPGFTALCGPTGDDPNLFDWIPDSTSFEMALQSYINEFSSAKVENLVLRPPNADSACVEYVVQDVTVIMISQASPLEYTLRFSLDGVKQRKVRRRRWRSPGGNVHKWASRQVDL